MTVKMSFRLRHVSQKKLLVEKCDK